MPKKLTEALAFDCIVAPQDVGTADVTGAWTSVADAKRFVVLAKAGAVTAGKTLTVQLRQATSAAGASRRTSPTAASTARSGGRRGRGRPRRASRSRRCRAPP